VVASSREPATLGTALSLFTTTVLTSAFGFAFWAVAARVYSPAVVGASSAAISAMQFVTIFAMLGLGTLLIAELSKRPRHSSDYLMTALAVSALAGTVGALVFALAARRLSPAALSAVHGLFPLATFTATAAITSALLVLDNALIALARASWQVWRNLAFSAVKLLLLPVAAVVWGAGSSEAVMAAWLAGTGASFLVLVTLAIANRVRWLGQPRWGLLRQFRSVALAHHWINLAQVAPRLLLPVLVAGYLSPVTNASFYAALLLVGFAYIVPNHLATALFAVASGEVDLLTRELRRTMVVFLVVAVATALIFAVAANPMLDTFGPGYDSAAGALIVMGLATAPTGVKAYYAAVCRVHGDLRRAALLCSTGSGLEIAVVWIALALGADVLAVGAAWVAAMSLEAVVFWPAVAAAGNLPGQLRGRIAELLRWSAPNTLGHRVACSSR
jgi:O-antigen/teichoic acid export membrane protein